MTFQKKENRPESMKPQAEVAGKDSADELRKMQESVKQNIYDLIKMAEKTGLSLKEIFPQPPAADQAIQESDPGEQINSPLNPISKTQYKPGEVIGDATRMNSQWKPWTMADIQDGPRIPLVPLPVPGLVWPVPDELGRQKIRLCNAELTCWLTVGELQEVPTFFSWIYDEALNQYKQAEEYKRVGPESAPWGVINGETGRRAWFHQPTAATFGMDIDGNPLTNINGQNPFMPKGGGQPFAEGTPETAAE
jgi:hypothetical protein